MPSNIEYVIDKHYKAVIRFYEFDGPKFLFKVAYKTKYAIFLNLLIDCLHKLLISGHKNVIANQ